MDRAADPTLIEGELRELVRGVGLVGECDLSLDGRASTLARSNLQTLLDDGQPCARICRHYPATVVVYLVSQGIYRYNHGGFWPELDVRGIDPQEMGPGCIEALRELRLDTFEYVRPDGAYSKITPILLHGGIPKFCARDILQLLVGEMRQGGRDATEIANRWFSSPSRLFALDRPARRFLTHGGDQAIDLLERLIAMVEARSAGQTLDADELALPSYLVEEYLALPDEVGTVRSRGALVPSPSIRFDYTSGAGPELHLPAVERSVGARTWLVVGARVQRVPVLASAEQLIPLHEDSSWEVTLMGPQDPLRTVSFRGAAGARVLFFDPLTQTLLRNQDRLASESVIALAPAGFAFRSGGPSGTEVPLIDAELPPLDGTWRWFEARHLNLSGLTQLWVGDPNPLAPKAASVTIRVTGPSHRPTLQGAVCAGVVGADGRPVFSKVPAIRIPGASRSDLHRWRLRAVVNGVAHAMPLSELPDGSDGALDLGHLVPGDRLSSVSLDVIGPLGSDLRAAQFHVVPGLAIEETAHVLLPHEQATLVVLADDCIELGEGAVGVRTITVEPHSDAATIAVRDPDTTLELVVSVPRLMWTMRGSGDISSPFATRLIELAGEDVSSDDALIVRTRRRVKLCLQLAVGDFVLQELPYAETVGQDGRWTFALTPFVGTIAQADQPKLQLRLVLGGRAVVVAEVIATYIASILSAESIADADAELALLSLTFSENRVFRNRQVRLWSIDRPWALAHVLDVDDEVVGADGIVITLEAPPGRYLVEVCLRDDWAAPRRPRRGAAGTAEVEVGGRFDATRYLASRDRSNPVDRLELVLAGSTEHFEWTAAELAEVAPLAVAAAIALLEELGAKAVGEQRLERLAALLSSADVLVPGVAAAVDDGRLDPGSVTSLVVMCMPSLLGRPSESDERVARRAHRLDSVLGALLDPAFVDDAAAGSRWEEYLGWYPDNGDPTRAYPFKGGPVDENWLRVSAERVRLIELSLDLRDDKPLAEGGYLSAMFEWLRAIADGAGPDVLHWIECHRPLNDGRLPRLSEQHRLFLEAVKPQGVGFPIMARMPYDLLAAAMHLVSIPNSRAKATAALLDAIRICPKLVQRCLLAAIVLDRG